jgi:hypothetical protein
MHKGTCAGSNGFKGDGHDDKEQSRTKDHRKANAYTGIKVSRPRHAQKLRATKLDVANVELLLSHIKPREENAQGDGGQEENDDEYPVRFPGRARETETQPPVLRVLHSKPKGSNDDHRGQEKDQ